MKKRNLSIVLAVAGLPAGLWCARLAWRAHEGLVTLNVRNAPLAAVVKSIERQTWQRIITDKQLNPGIPITIMVKNEPVSRVLGIVASKAGARFQTTYAVYDSNDELRRLESALEGGAELDATGWTNLAPALSDEAFPGREESGADNFQPKPGEQMRGIGPDGPTMQSSASGGLVRKGGGNERILTVLPDGKVDRWSGERIVIDDSLLTRLTGPAPEEATPDMAARTAEAVHGRSRVYYVLEKAPFATGGPRHRHLTRNGGGRENIGDAAAAIEQERRQGRLRELSDSPEVQVERARQQGGHRMQIQTGGETK